MPRRPQTQSRNNVTTIMTKLNRCGKENLDRLRVLTEDILDLPVSNAVVLQRGLQLYLDLFNLHLIRIPPEDAWKANERLNLIRTAQGTITENDGGQDNIDRNDIRREETERA
jgi:hypothetical protein